MTVAGGIEIIVIGFVDRSRGFGAPLRWVKSLVFGMSAARPGVKVQLGDSEG